MSKQLKNLGDKAVLLNATREEAKRSVDLVYGDFKDFPWQDPRAYGNWLAQTYYYVLHATRLLTYAAARCSFDEEDLHQSLIKGAREENRHELLALNDLKNLGFTLEDFPELPETAAYHQTLYFAIDHDGPASLVGYFLPLEGAAGLRMRTNYERLKQLFPKSVSFLHVHCDLDVGHFDEGLKDLEHFDERQLAAVHKNIKLSVALYRGMVEGLWRAVPGHEKRRRAA